MIMMMKMNLINFTMYFKNFYFKFLKCIQIIINMTTAPIPISVPIANISNPIPILQQESSNITTNTLIPKRSTIEVELPQQKKFQIEYLVKISSNFIGFFNDLFIKPVDISWLDYLQTIIKKEQRYYYIGIFLIALAILISLLQQIFN